MSKNHQPHFFATIVNKILAKTGITSPTFIIFQKQIKTNSISSAPILNKNIYWPRPTCIYLISDFLDCFFK